MHQAAISQIKGYIKGVVTTSVATLAHLTEDSAPSHGIKIILRSHTPV